MKRIVCGEDDRVGAFACGILNRKWVPGEAATIGLESNGELVAGVLYMDFNGVNVHMHIGTNRINWLTREFLWFSFHYPFEQLGAKRITVTTAESNRKALAFEKHLGFLEEGRLKNAHPDGDIIALVMWKDACRFLRKKNATNAR